MIAMQTAEAARVLGVALIGADRAFRGVSTDSRDIEADQLFFALRGENFDGNRFVAQAAERGAAAAVVSARVDANIPQLVVPDTTLALGKLAHDWRRRFAIPMLALTGSNGKTTVKEMLRSILVAHCGDAGQVLVTEGNLNNHIGLPQMLLRLEAKHRYAVFEMGMNHRQEIDYLTRIAEPDVALIIMAGTAHIGELGSREAIAEAKGELVAALGPQGIAVINMHDRFGAYWRGLAGDRRVVGFGIADEDEVVGEFSRERLVIRSGAESIEVHLHVVGEHNQRNALAAAAGAVALGVPLQTIRTGLEDFEGVAGRLRSYSGHKGATIIDDTYNANPDSVRAAIDVLAQKPGKRLLVLGDMGELGVDAPSMHSQIGAYARNANLDGTYALGKLTEATVMELGSSGWHFDSVDELAEELDRHLGPDVTVLVKGSRFMKMERVVEKLVPGFHGGHH
ncbi:MAG: UDP-N-acetylmuramoyl-tripeptide--D-alanyl-D-alanine ligase [Betaproteobacteria bacterium]|nr:UDP-N-acetylmuramoyl-tripeptide--D-alanyl-D-alanine ligase [Betaproteobacteria bacterium]